MSFYRLFSARPCSYKRGIDSTPTIHAMPSIFLAVFLFVLPGCMPTKATRVAGAALTMQDVATAASKQSNLHVVREGTPAYLMLVDALIEAYPDNRDLLIAACQAYSSYASMLPEDEGRDKSEALYRKAKLYGFRTLSRHGDFARAATGDLTEFKALLSRFNKEDVPALFWTAGAWAGWIGSDMNNVEAMADISALEAVLKRLIELDESFHYGGPHVYMAVYLAVKPAMLGGNLEQARLHFDRAFALGGDKLLTNRVLFAQYYAHGVRDRALFEDSLRQVLNAKIDEIPELTLSNAAAQEKAGLLLNKAEEYFEELP